MTESTAAAPTAQHHGGILCPGAIVTPAGVRYALVVSPRADGDIEGAWHENDELLLAGADSFHDGLANTLAMAEAGSQLARQILALRIGGHADWYLPSRDELELLYRHFKPTTQTNYVHRNGDNPSSLPPGYPYTVQAPAQTTFEDFRAGGAQAFEDEWYWSSTQHSEGYAWGQGFYYGSQGCSDKSFQARARAVRRFLLA